MTVTPIVGSPINATVGAWINNPMAYLYQWNSSATGALSGATSPSYTPAVADVGNTLTVSVIATNGAGASAPATSAPTNPVLPATGPPGQSGLNIDIGIGIGEETTSL